MPSSDRLEFSTIHSFAAQRQMIGNGAARFASSPAAQSRSPTSAPETDSMRTVLDSTILAADRFHQFVFEMNFRNPRTKMNSRCPCGETLQRAAHALTTESFSLNTEALRIATLVDCARRFAAAAKLPPVTEPRLPLRQAVGLTKHRNSSCGASFIGRLRPDPG